MRDTGKSRYFVVTEFTNCFIIRSPSLCFNISSESEAICLFSPENVSRVVSFTHEQNIICSQTLSQTQLDDNAHEQTIICRQPVKAARSGGGLSAKEKEEILHRMIIRFVLQTEISGKYNSPVLLLLLFYFLSLCFL